MYFCSSCALAQVNDADAANISISAQRMFFLSFHMLSFGWFDAGKVMIVQYVFQTFAVRMCQILPIFDTFFAGKE